MKTLLVLILFVGVSSPCRAETVTSVVESWRYLIKSTGSERWVVISSKINEGFFQCEKLDTFISCPIPVWRTALPGTNVTESAEFRTHRPYPALPGAEKTEYLTEKQVASARKVLKRLGLESEDVYSQLFDPTDPKKAVVGTSFDVRIELRLDYGRFPELVEAYLFEVWGVSADKGYDFETAN